MLRAVVVLFLCTIPGIYNDEYAGCKIRFSRRVTRLEPYMQTYRDLSWGLLTQLKARLNFRTVYQTVYEEECCPGYRQRGSDTCEPVCSNGCPLRSNCVNPEVCECHPGYRQARSNDSNPGECLPICSHGCPNGECVDPDRCRCNAGYYMAKDGFTCLPICSLDCAELNGYCVSPDQCECKAGYRKDTSGNASSCVPHCGTPCVNGLCTMPNTCTCAAGYRPRDNDSSICEPVCSQDCGFGKCTAPDTCTCDTGYKLNEKSTCVPGCSKRCVNGACVAPETCSCLDGYGSRNSSRHVCEPICRRGCANGTCTAPGNCVCNEGYLADGVEGEEQICKPFCRVPCEPHGECVAPGTCNCFVGYGIDDSRKDTVTTGSDDAAASPCVPLCDRTCVNGKCVEPDLCECDPGYERSLNESSAACEPRCDTACGRNSTCTAPGTCTCDAGYILTENEVQNVCEPVCEIPCGANSTCVAPNACQCLKGFIAINDSCSPYCENDCGDAECVAPGECRNHDSVGPYTKIRGRHGSCAKDGEPCDCFYGWTGPDCDQPTVCILSMNTSDRVLNWLTVQHKWSDRIADAITHAPRCYPCNKSVANDSFCFIDPPGIDQAAISCLIQAGSPCYSMQLGEKATTTTLAAVLSSLAILALAIGSTAAYFVIRGQRRRRMHAVIVQNAMFQGTVANEVLLSEEENVTE